jgi:hypothetical protein
MGLGIILAKNYVIALIYNDDLCESGHIGPVIWGLAMYKTVMLMI